MVIAASNYSYSANAEPVAGNHLTVPFAGACQHIAASGYEDLYLLPGQFFARELSEQLELGSAACTAAELESVRDAASAAGLRINAVLVPASDDAARYRRCIDHAAALGCRWLIDFGAAAEAEADYVSLMRDVAPHAASRGLGISMKLHHPFATGVRNSNAAPLLRHCLMKPDRVPRQAPDERNGNYGNML